MAKSVVIERDKVVHLVRHQIVCSDCGEAKGPLGQQAIKKWEGRDWYCSTCRPGPKGLKPLCTCGHRKTHHASAKGKCLRAWRKVDGRYGWYRKWMLERPRAQAKGWEFCECKKYTPQ